MVVEAILIGLIVGFYRNGRLHHLMDVEFKGWYLVFLGAALQIIPIAATRLTEQIAALQWAPFVGIVLIWIAVIMNYKLKGFRLIALGALLNMLVMVVHAGKMPFNVNLANMTGISALAESVKSGTVANLIDMNASGSLLKWLGKTIPLPPPYPLAKMVSLGDVIVSVGIGYFIQGEMVFYHFRNKGKMVNFSIRSK